MKSSNSTDDTWAEKLRPTYPVAIGDCPGGDLDRGDVEVEEADKGQKMFKCFEGKE